jgi:hypothetical protein
MDTLSVPMGLSAFAGAGYVVGHWLISGWRGREARRQRRLADQAMERLHRPHWDRAMLRTRRMTLRPDRKLLELGAILDASGRALQPNDKRSG